ncbi:hypothetical protein [Halopenitus persicus]|uniref:hypothetical protein n=1 Tax=Halopenitus persicus TaxID=1048396 RepID=UPI000BBAB5C9|nr:hypothetical protein [Halopenitus persicus]
MIRKAIVVALLALVVSSGFAPLAAAQGDVIAIDEDNHLATDAAVEEFQSDGKTTAEIDRVQMTLSVHDDPCEAGLDPIVCSTQNTYLRVQYDEGIERTVRVKVDAELVEPRVKQGLQAENSDAVVANVEPGENGEYTVITLELDGKSDAVFEFNAAEGMLWDVRHSASGAVEDVTGISAPDNPLSSGEWQYVDPSALAGEDTTKHLDVPDGATVQYDRGDIENTTEDSTWLAVPDCENPSEQPVCSYEADGESGVYVMSTQEEPPQVRYTDGVSPGGHVGGALNELQSIVDDTLNQFGSLFE